MAESAEPLDLADTEEKVAETPPPPVEKPDGEGEVKKEEEAEEGGATGERPGKAAEGEKKEEEEEKEATPLDESKLKELLDDNSTNVKNLTCARCQSVVLRPGLAKVTQKEYFLPHMKIKSAKQEPSDGETLRDFWLVKGMYTFENVGFTNTVKDIKYLICADCEVGPIGCHDLKVKDEFYVAVDRVTYT